MTTRKTKSKTPPSSFVRDYPAAYAVCRVFGHQEAPFTVARPDGPRAGMIVTVICVNCDRLRPIAFTAGYKRTDKKLAPKYEPGYLAPSGTGRIHSSEFAEKAVIEVTSKLIGDLS
jgi:hypothetical protein